ncbi:MAG: altronate dehydratase family protein [Clostridiales bacterium]|nr:altronate dehydratase family protein [Clostridiales bacterium]
MPAFLRIHPADNVAVALEPLEAGAVLALPEGSVTALEPIPAGHKIALKDLAEGDNIIKYGFPIGHATRPIPQGSHVHIQNLKTNLSETLSYTWQPAPEAALPKVEGRTFLGYPRKDGRVGIRNELWILPTVGCVNDIAKALEREYQSLVGPGIDHVYAFPHPYGCSQMGDDQENTRQILADLMTHPNVGGVLLMGLGCENSSIAEIRKHLPADADESRMRFLICQQEDDEFEAAGKLIRELADQMRSETRVPCPASALVVGLKCGGSDGFSGITANPVIGGLSDRMAALGGSTILTEVPEMFGAETILMSRCPTEELFQKTVSLINDFKRYYQENHQTIYENPSPGNKAGGISSLEDKALGCTQKSGFSPVRGVLSYGEKVSEKGLNLLSAPGNDLVAATALASSGAHLVLFSTGRGTPFACPVPTLKIATNPTLAEHKANWIDFAAGDLLKGKTLDQLADALLDLVLEVASGKQVVSEARGFHDLAIFKTGVTL